MQPSQGQKGRNTEPFSNFLESAANQPSADRHSPESRADAVSSNENGGTGSSANSDGTTFTGGASEGDTSSATATDDANQQMMPTGEEAPTGESVGIAPFFGLAMDGELTEEGAVVEAGADDPVEGSEESVSLASIPDADSGGQNADAPGSDEDLVPADESASDLEAATATAGIATGTQGVDQGDPVHAAASGSRTAAASSAMTQPEAAAANQARAATSVPEQAPSQPSSQSFNAAIAAEGETSMQSEDDADAQLSQRQRDGLSSEVKPQDAKAAIETAKPVKPAAESGAAKAQPIALPESVSALYMSFKPTSMHAANMNERPALPLSASAIAVEIVSRMRDGMRRFDIRLDPPELGRIDVRLDVDRDGNVKTKLTLDRPETLELMQRDARGLERALQQAGLKTDAGGLEFSLRSQAGDNLAQNHFGKNGNRPDSLAGDDGERIEAVIEEYRSAARARGGVDIRI
jgi:flagellar hook-length control protein FliK